MEIITTEIPEVFIIQPKVFQDDRGFFFMKVLTLELFKKKQA